MKDTNMKCNKMGHHRGRDFEDMKLDADKDDLVYQMIYAGHTLMHRTGKRHGQGRILRILAETDDITQKNLQEKLKVEAGSLSEILNKLEKHELITKEKDEEDKRRMRISLTEKGRKVIEERKDSEGKDKLFDAITEEEKEELKRILKKLNVKWNEERELRKKEGCTRMEDEEHHVHHREHGGRHMHGHDRGRE